MFNTLIDRSTRFPKTVEVNHHEHRAPTDESIRMAQELRERVIQGILSDEPLCRDLRRQILGTIVKDEWAEKSGDQIVDVRTTVSENKNTHSKDILVSMKINGRVAVFRESVTNEELNACHPGVVKAAVKRDLEEQIGRWFSKDLVRL